MSKSIVKSKNYKPAIPKKPTIGQIEQAMLLKYPVHTACEWDVTGVTVGEKSNKVKKIAIALDATTQAIMIAKRSGANLLITHHPVFINNFSTLLPGNPAYEAAFNGVTLMNFHTALDKSEEGLTVLPSLLSLEPKKGACSVEGFGKVCKCKLTLKQLAARCKSIFGKDPRVWGSFSTKLTKVVTTTGSVGDVIEGAFAAKAQCVICGEVKYHDALEAAQAGMCIIDLGHDVSELPFIGKLAADLVDLGIKKEDIVLVDQSHNWRCPDSIKTN